MLFYCIYVKLSAITKILSCTYRIFLQCKSICVITGVKKALQLKKVALIVCCTYPSFSVVD